MTLVRVLVKFHDKKDSLKSYLAALFNLRFAGVVFWKHVIWVELLDLSNNLLSRQ